MRYGSVCSGIEAASVAWHPLGWQPHFFSEIEKFPCKVLQHHFPSVPNYGDMTKFKEWPDVGIDLLVGGTPCQAFSVAGLRQGLADPRGNLALVYLGVVDKYRPRWVVWENVPGVLSSSGGRDFGAFLGALGELGYGWAYRVLDAQHFGVPQRRRRVFVVGHLGDWRRAAAVLFERENQELASEQSENKAESVTAFTPSSFGQWRRGVGTVRANAGTPRTDLIVASQTVRRVIPIETERLQGFSDDWTLIPTASDSARYKAIGNSMAVPCMRWIGEGVAEVDKL
jgi:DNA (cytosine-5)-methyltransferase 1